MSDTGPSWPSCFVFVLAVVLLCLVACIWQCDQLEGKRDLVALLLVDVWLVYCLSCILGPRVNWPAVKVL